MGGGGGGDADDEGNTPSPNIRFCIPPSSLPSCSMASLRILHVITSISIMIIIIIIITTTTIIINSSSIYLYRSISAATCSVLAAILRSSLKEQARYKRGWELSVIVGALYQRDDVI
jgi:uncharacterized protein involved in response to NO